MLAPCKSQKSRAFALAFAIPVVSMLMIMLIGGYEPFGSLSMLYSDMYHQYYPFWLELRRALRSGEFPLYTWSVGLGMDFLSLISYYLASPLNLLGVLVPDGLTLEFYSLLMPVKLGLASLFFSMFLSRAFDRTDYSVSLFGAMYGMCAWALGYQWNVMWLDTFALLPLLALGTLYLLRDRKFWLYTVTLFLSVYSNYYIGFFVCIFVLLVFICYEICRWKSVGRFFADFFRIGIFTLIALGMTAVMMLPALAGLANTQSSVNTFPHGFRLNIAKENTFLGLLDGMRQVAGNIMGGLEPTFKEGLPNLYCGVISVILAVLFCTDRKVRLRDKLCSLGLLLFFTLSFLIRQLDYIWHGFHFTNMIPYRFSFLYSFVVLYMAYRAYLHCSGFKLWQILLAAALAVGLVICSDQRSDWAFLCYNGGFILLYVLLMIFALPRRQHSAAPEAYNPNGDLDNTLVSIKIQTLEEFSEDSFQAEQKPSGFDLHRLAPTLLLVVMCLEIILNALNFGLRFPATNTVNYPKGTRDAAAVMEYMKEKEAATPFYRAETTHSQTLNDGALNNYYGISTFTSSANVKVTEFMRALGYGAKNTYNRYCYEESSPVCDLFLGIKYRIERDGGDRSGLHYTPAFSSGQVTLLENNFYLPLGFVASPELADLAFNNADHFNFQNQLFRAAAGLSGDIWHVIPSASIEALNTELTSSSGSYCSYENSESGASVTYRYVADRDGYLCLDFDANKRNSYKVFCNGTQLFSEKLSLPQMIAACDVTTGDEITVELSCKKDEKGHMTVQAGILDEQMFREGYDILNRSTFDPASVTRSRVAGTVSCAGEGLLYTSVPDDGNWVVLVDGEETSHRLVGGAMIAVDLAEGEHDILFEYHSRAFSAGLTVSLVSAGIFLLCLAGSCLRRQGRFQK